MTALLMALDRQPYLRIALICLAVLTTATLVSRVTYGNQESDPCLAQATASKNRHVTAMNRRRLEESARAAPRPFILGGLVLVALGGTTRRPLFMSF